MKKNRSFERWNTVAKVLVASSLVFSVSTAEAAVACLVDIVNVRFRTKKAQVEVTVDILDAAGNLESADHLWYLCKTELTDAEEQSQAASPNSYIDPDGCYQLITMMEIAMTTDRRMYFQFDGTTPSTTAGTATSCADVIQASGSLLHHLALVQIKNY